MYSWHLRTDFWDNYRTDYSVDKRSHCIEAFQLAAVCAAWRLNAVLKPAIRIVRRVCGFENSKA